MFNIYLNLNNRVKERGQKETTGERYTPATRQYYFRYEVR
ncbi:hypothetical protein GCM10023095_13270 [Pseudaeromonas paramecii]|uniref:Uncharacterized protein n=1 Tax=Pseudaeromonas paramecii TaxID=2138166 RepID=A0ABP8Q619_9GAMM